MVKTFLLDETDIEISRSLADSMRRKLGPKQILPARIYEVMARDIDKLLLSVAHKSLLAKISEHILGPVIFEKIWVVDSCYGAVDCESLPFLPHIDLKRSIKVMIYLNDVELKDGPMFIASGVEPERFEMCRKSMRQKGDNVISEFLDYVPLVGRAGHAHVFDTNVPHYAGLLAPGGQRHVLRLDYVF